MRIVILAISILLLSYIIKIDIFDGTISRAAFSQIETECENLVSYEILPVQTIEGDTIFSLFTLHPSQVWVSLPERLASFYKENPHLKKQTILPGEIVNLPVYMMAENSCS
jgi:hypothetical protein